MGRRLTRERLAGRGAGLTFAVVGCGLVGGSVALALRRRWPRAEVVGVDRPAVRTEALRRRAIGRAATRRELWAELHALDLLVLATPVAAIIHDVARLPRRGGPLTLDVGSVKGPIVAAARDVERFVGGHPMAGSERGGIAQASASLLQGRPFALTPTVHTSRATLHEARRIVTELGARPLLLDAAIHDRCVALVSHLPHLLALCLMDEGRSLARELGDALPWSLAAGSWRDATRVAASDPALWADIFATNREALVPVLERLAHRLSAAGIALRRGSPVVPDARALARLRNRLGPKLPR